MDFSVVWKFKQFIIDGLLVTLQLSVTVICLSLVFGLMISLMLTGKNRVLKYLAKVYVLIFRSAPPLIQLFLFYYGLAYMGINFTIFQSVSLMFTLYAGAYVSEIFRSGIEAVPKGQYEAADCIGLNSWEKTRCIIFPQAFKISLPPLISFYLSLIKDTSIASIVGYKDLIKQGQVVITNTRHPFEVYIVIAAIYFVICYPISRVARWTEKRRSAA